MSLRLQGVGLVHADGTRALTGIDLQVAAGERVALIGPSGAGKTTLLSLLATALPASAGTCRILDFTVDRASTVKMLQTLRPRLGLIHQAAPLPGRQRAVTAVLAGRLGQWPLWKSLASLLYPQDLAGAHAALARLDLADKLFARCDQLSGGQLQRVGIARVLYQQPELILADEPVSALDPALARQTIALLVAEAEQRQATLVASLHAVDLALGHFSRIVGLKAGRIAFDLPVAAVDAALLQELYAGETPAAAAEPLAPFAAGRQTAARAACG